MAKNILLIEYKLENYYLKINLLNEYLLLHHYKFLYFYTKLTPI